MLAKAKESLKVAFDGLDEIDNEILSYEEQIQEVQVSWIEM